MAGIAPTVRTTPDRPLRVLHVTWRLSRTGGIPLVIRALIEHNDPERCEVHVATVRPALDEDGLGELAARVTIHPLGFEGRLGPVARVRAMVGFARLQQRLRADVVHAHSGTAVLALAAALVRRGTARLLDVHDAPGSGRHGRRTDRLEGLLCRLAGFVPVVHSTSVQADVAREWSLPEDRAMLVPLGIDTAAITPVTEPPPIPVVLYVARLVPTKNVGLFLDLAAAVGPRASFVVVGGGSELDRLRSRVAAEGLDHVELAGHVPTSLAETYRRASIFVSTSDYEGFGLAVVEAMSAGLPVVATAVGGVTDLVADGETGHLVPSGDLDALHRCVTGLLDDPARARQLGQAGARRAHERFDVRAMTGRYIDVYEQAVHERREAS